MVIFFGRSLPWPVLDEFSPARGLDAEVDPQASGDLRFPYLTVVPRAIQAQVPSLWHHTAHNVAPLGGSSGLRKILNRFSVGRTREVINRMPMARRPRSGLADAAAVGTQG